MDFRVLDARLMPWRNRFDIVFSNAAFHWQSVRLVSLICRPDLFLTSAFLTGLFLSGLFRSGFFLFRFIKEKV